MDFNTFVDQAWNGHAADSAKVADSLKQGLALIQTQDHLGQLAHLAHHVYGEHLGQWEQGINFLNLLAQHPQLGKDSEIDKSMIRFIDSLILSNGDEMNLSEKPFSDQIRILALSANALGLQNQIDRTKLYLSRALELAQAEISKEDVANRTLAICGNNLASSLAEKNNLSDVEVDLMIFAAKMARKY
jgi:hypothetical protein